MFIDAQPGSRATDPLLGADQCAFAADPGMPELPRSLIDSLPRDQALGLRLIALARAAAAVHMGQTAAEQARVGAV